MNELTQRGINALRAGDPATARSLLSAAVKQDPNDSTAWLWLSGAVEGDEERIQCLEQVLRLEPDNAAAARGLAKTLQKRAIAATAAAAPATPVATATPVAAPVAAPSALPVETTAELVQLDSTPAAPAEAAVELPAAEATAGQLVQPTAAPETPAPSVSETTAAEAAASEAAAEAVSSARASGRRKRSKAIKEGAQLIFRTRPSVVIALIGFWVFLAGASALGYLLRGDLVLALVFGAGLGLVLEAIVVYAIISNFAVRYELTNQQLTLRFRGKRTRIPVEDIYHAEYRQTFVQQIIGAGDVLIEAVVNGELARLRMRNIPECKRRTDQIKSVINESPA